MLSSVSSLQKLLHVYGGETKQFHTYGQPKIFHMYIVATQRSVYLKRMVDQGSNRHQANQSVNRSDIVWFQKISIPPHGGFFQFEPPPPPPRIFRSRGLHLFPPTPWNFQDFSTWSPYPQEIPNPQRKRLHYFILTYSEPK